MEHAQPHTRRQAGTEPASPQPAADGDESPRVVLDQADLAALVSRAAEAAAEKAATAATSALEGKFAELVAIGGELMTRPVEKHMHRLLI